MVAVVVILKVRGEDTSELLSLGASRGVGPNLWFVQRLGAFANRNHESTVFPPLDLCFGEDSSAEGLHLNFIEARKVFQRNFEAARFRVSFLMKK